MKCMGEANVIGIATFQARSQGLLGLSQKAYINNVLEGFKFKNYPANVNPIQKGNKFCLMQCPKNELECKKKMTAIHYTSLVGSLMYA